MRFRLASMLAIALAVWPHAVRGTQQNPENGTSLQTYETAQNPDYTSPAHVAYVEGTATLERDGRPESAPLNMPLLSGDRLKTLNGRVEVLFADGSALHLDSQTTIDLQSDELVRLIDGRVRLNIAGLADASQSRLARVAYRVDSPAGSVRVTQPGEYRVAILRRAEEMQLELAVIRGAGEIFTDEGTTAVRAGERAYASAGLAPSYAYAYNSANWDAFDRWSESRRDTRLGVSAQYLPSEVRAYSSTFDEDGDWRYTQPYGYVWYPRVAVSWRPYYYGRWAQYPRYGWTWIGVDRFAWPTHHYGRWGFSAGVWFWIPAARWAPAYVSWAYAPGYVSWCPLGFDNRPVIAINIFNVRPGYYSSWRAWTSVGYTHFGRDYVHRRAVDWDRFDRGRHPAFQVAQTAPAYRDVAVPRAAPIRAAGSRNLPADRPPSGGRSASADTPRYVNRGDEIIRSRTERPSPTPRATDFNTAVPRSSSQGVASGGAERTAPAGPARRIDSLDTPEVTRDMDRSRGVRERGGVSMPRSAYERPSAGAQGAPSHVEGRGGVTPRPDAPVYQPPMRTYDRSDSYRAVPRSAPSESIVPRREPMEQVAPDSGPRGYMRPRPSTGAQGAGYEPRSAPSAGERQAPPPRAMPAPEPSAPSRDVAVPRGPGGARPAPSAPPPAAGMPSGARSRGRGGQ